MRLQDLGYLTAMLAALVAWSVAVVAALPLALAERRLKRRAARGALVLGTLLVVSIGRPFLNDAVASVLFGHDSTEAWLQRIATNGLIWFTLLPIVAATAAWYADSRSSANRLAAALAVFDDLRHRIARYGQDNSALLGEAVAQLRGRRDALLDEYVDFDAVRGFADEVRATSHRLDERLQAPLDHRSGYALPTSRDRGGIVSPFALLARPPAALIAVVYFAASAPYTYVVGGWPLALAALAMLAVLALAADLASRVLGAGRDPGAHGAIVMACWIAVGIVMTAAGMLLTSVDLIVLLVPLIALPGLAAVVAFGAGALQRTREDSHTLTQLFGDDLHDHDGPDRPRARAALACCRPPA